MKPEREFFDPSSLRDLLRWLDPLAFLRGAESKGMGRLVRGAVRAGPSVGT